MSALRHMAQKAKSLKPVEILVAQECADKVTGVVITGVRIEEVFDPIDA